MEFRVKTNDYRQVIDITEQVQEQLDRLEAYNGVVTVTVMHTTCAITVADMDPGTDQDHLRFLDSLIPDIQWNHPHDPSHMPSHLLSMLVGVSASLPVQKGQLQLGTWQRIVLLEFEGPRDRQVFVSFATGH